MKRYLLLAWLYSLPAWATVSITQQNSTNTATVTSATCALSSTVTSGDILEIDGFFGNSPVTTISATDTLSNTFAHVTGSPVAYTTAGSNDVYMMWVKTGSGGASDTITVSVTGGGSHRIVIACREFASTTGWAASPFDTSNTSTSNTGPTLVTGAITPAAAGELIVGTCANDGTVAVWSITAGSCTLNEAGGSSGNGYANAGKDDGCDNLSGPSGSQTVTFHYSAGGTAGNASILSAFKPSTGATAATMPPAVY